MTTRGRKAHNERDEERARYLGGHVRRSRERLQLSQQDLAVRAGVAISTLQKIERAETKDPGFFTVTRLAAELALPLSNLAEADE